ncbi:hypothetical protein [Cryptosporangium sp. NPDC051539]|uniref:hypothetical protein n=1 Tax=Cryptosporangium sp. NPDC051539 TaxID=3363962 RepID=UPI0037A1F511
MTAPTLAPPRSRRHSHDTAVITGFFVADVLISFDRYYLGRLFALDSHAFAALALGAAGFACLAARHRYPLAVYWLTLVHALALSVLTNHLYTSVVSVWLALHAVARYRTGPVGYLALITALAPSAVMAGYLYAVTADPSDYTAPILVASYVVVTFGFWQDGHRRRQAVQR